MAVVEFHGRVMASDLHVIAVVAPDAVGTCDGAIREVVSFVEHLERCWSRFIAASDISRINRLGADGGGRIEVDNSTIYLLDSMVSGYDYTGGLFNPSMLRAVVHEGYAASWVDPAIVTEALASDAQWGAASLHDLQIDPSTKTVSVPAGLALDAGGIGKGLAADLAVAQLLSAGARGALVGIGGDLAMAGHPVDGSGWLVNVEQPDPAEGVLCSLAVSGGGVATSSTRSRRWMVDGVERHHQIDAFTKRCSLTDLDAVTVIAPTGWLAEVHATAALSVGSAAVISYLDGHGLTGVALCRPGSPVPVLTTTDVAFAAVTQTVVVR
jgi:thiamine biosynthesis lipoprotein